MTARSKAAQAISGNAITVDPAWIDEQMKHFPEGSMDGAVRLIRQFERADRERAVAEQGSAA